MVKKPYPDPSAMKILLEIIAESNLKVKSLNLASVVDASFVERLDREDCLTSRVCLNGLF